VFLLKSNIATAAFFLLCILVFGFAMNSCVGTATKDRFGYTNRNFDARICGSIEGDEVAVTLKSRPDALEGEYEATLSFEAPASLCGLVLSRGADGICEARLYELIMRDFKADGLIEPFLSLVYSGEIALATQNSVGDAIIYVKNETCDLEYTFPEGYDYPHRIKGVVNDREIELFVERLDFVS
jgi:hypothetical protein